VRWGHGARSGGRPCSCPGGFKLMINTQSKSVAPESSSLQMVTIKVLTEIKGMSEAKVTKIREVAIKLVGFGFHTGTYMLEKRKHVVRITTGSENLDTLLGGGIESCSITGAVVYVHGWVRLRFVDGADVILLSCMTEFGSRAEWRVPDWQDPAVSHPLCHGPAAKGNEGGQR
jgi:hypothetical protein